MRQMKRIIISVFLVTFSLALDAQEKDWGYVSASLESTSHIYSEDKVNGFDPDVLVELKDGKAVETNTYLKADYY